LSHVDGTVHPGTSHIFAGLRCRLCGSTKRAATMVICDVCSTGWHLECLTWRFQLDSGLAQSVLGVEGLIEEI
jgi:hypothetical protein